jgi:predicted GNAT family acetyltransferase
MSDQKPTIEIERSEEDGRGVFFFAKQGIRLAEMTYSRTDEKLVIIDHTEVSEQLQGLGVGRKLLNATVAWARETGTKIIPICPYAKAQFERDASIRDVLA